MAQFKYVGPSAVTYPFLILDGAGLHAEPGDVMEFDAAPDANWQEVNADAASASVPSPDPAEGFTPDPPQNDDTAEAPVPADAPDDATAPPVEGDTAPVAQPEPIPDSAPAADPAADPSTTDTADAAPAHQED